MPITESSIRSIKVGCVIQKTFSNGDRQFGTVYNIMLGFAHHELSVVWFDGSTENIVWDNSVSCLFLNTEDLLRHIFTYEALVTKK